MLPPLADRSVFQPFSLAVIDPTYTRLAHRDADAGGECPVEPHAARQWPKNQLPFWSQMSLGGAYQPDRNNRISKLHA
jgi:hypothetical protein